MVAFEKIHENPHQPFINSSWSIGSSSSSGFGTTRGNNQTVNPKSSSAFTESPVITHTGFLHGLRDQAALVFDGQQMNEFFLFLLLHLSWASSHTSPPAAQTLRFLACAGALQKKRGGKLITTGQHQRMTVYRVHRKINVK